MDDPVDPPRKKRGINKIEDLPPNESVDFNKHGLAVGKYQYLFGKYIGTRTRRNISILIKSWNKVPKEDKDLLWIDIKRHFRIENDNVKKPTLRSCGDKWRAFKNKLQNEYMLKNISPRNTWTYIEPRIWEEFCRNEHYTTEKLKCSEVARKRGKQQMLRPRLGSKGYRGFQAEWDKERKDPNKATELHLIPCLRGSDFCLSRVPRDQHGNKVVTSELLKLSRDMTVASEQLSQGTIESEAGVDAVVLVLGAEHGGRTRGVGGNVGYKKGIEGYVRKKKKREDFEDIPDSLKQQQKKKKFKSSGLYLEMKEDIKADLRMEIREEMREEMRAEVREEMRAEIREETRAEIREKTGKCIPSLKQDKMTPRARP